MNKEALEALDELFEYIKMEGLGGIDKRQAADHCETTRTALTQQPVDLEGLKKDVLKEWGGNGIDKPDICDLEWVVDYLAARGLITVKPQWQPIETAPRDGTPILAAVRYGTTKKVLIVWWKEKHGTGMWLWSITQSYEIKPTHWMPIPKPPADI